MKKSSTNLLLVLRECVRKKGVLARGQNTIWAKVLEILRTVDW